MNPGILIAAETSPYCHLDVPCHWSITLPSRDLSAFLEDLFIRGRRTSATRQYSSASAELKTTVVWYVCHESQRPLSLSSLCDYRLVFAQQIV